MTPYLFTFELFIFPLIYKMTLESKQFVSLVYSYFWSN